MCFFFFFRISVLILLLFNNYSVPNWDPPCELCKCLYVCVIICFDPPRDLAIPKKGLYVHVAVRPRLNLNLIYTVDFLPFLFVWGADDCRQLYVRDK